MKVILYWMKGCQYCDKIKSELKDLPKDCKDPIKIEYSDISRSAREKCELKIYPTLVFLSDEDKFLEKLEGFKPLQTIINMYKKVDNLENVLQA